MSSTFRRIFNDKERRQKMKYGSKHEAKKWSLDTLDHGGLVATIPTPFDDNLQINESEFNLKKEN